MSFTQQIKEFLENDVKKIHPEFFEDVEKEINLVDSDTKKMEIIYTYLTKIELISIELLKNNCKDTGQFEPETVKKALFVFSLIYYSKLKFLYIKNSEKYFFETEQIENSKKIMESYIQKIIIAVQNCIETRIITEEERKDLEENLIDFTQRLDGILAQFD